jgi:hypothetical protein
MGSIASASLGIYVVGSYCAPYGLSVFDSRTRSLVRVLGVYGSGLVVGATAQMITPRWPAWAPWSTTTLLVPDSGNSRVIEVDVITGLLVKVWFTGLVETYGVAATSTRMVVTAGGAGPSPTLSMYDLKGALLWTVTSGLGTPSSVQFSADGSYVIVGEVGAQRVSKWTTATGAYIANVGSGFNQPYSVVECAVGTGVGLLAAQWAKNTVELVSDTGAITSSSTVLPTATGLGSAALAPGVGLLVVSQNEGLYFLTSVVILTQPVSASVTTPSSVTFTVALTATSATTGLTYAWTKGGVAVGTNSPSYTYAGTDVDVVAGPTFPIVCTVTHALGSAVTSAATLTVVRGVAVSPSTASVVIGGMGVTFTATPAAGNTVTTFAWTLGGVAVGTNSALFVMAAVSTATPGPQTLVCTVTATAGSASSSVIVTVQVRPGHR